MKYVLAIDQGTTGTTVLLVDENAHIRAKKNQEFKQSYPQPGWVEHDPEEIWKTTCQVIRQVLRDACIASKDITAIGITNQRETTVLWDKTTGNPVHPAIVWQDRRTSEFCHRLKKKGHEEWVTQKTGLVLDPYFSASKIRWLLDQVPLAKKLAKTGELMFGTIDSYLVYKLTGQSTHVTDVTNASRTLLMDLKTTEWDDELLKLFKIPQGILPRICSSSEVYGETYKVKGLPDGIPICGMAGDQQAALFGQACFLPGEAKCTYGTGSFLLMNVGSRPVFSQSGLLSSVAWRVGQKTEYVLEGSAFIAGAVVQWLRDQLKIINSAQEIEALAKTVDDNGGVSFVPAFAGLGAPHWQPDARAVICGLTRGTQRGHIARAALEGIAFRQHDILMAMQKDSKKTLKQLKVDGGAAANDLLMQFQSDILDVELLRPRIVETTAMGAAFLAGLAVGVWQDQEEIREKIKIEKIFLPSLDKKVRQSRIQVWGQAVEKSYGTG